MSPVKVYITGATGFIGSHVTRAALEAGYHVRLSIRKHNQIQDLKELFPSYHARLEFEEIPDITKPEAFENSFDGVAYVFHLASPMPGKGNDFQTDYVDPAVKGTNAILDAASRSDSVKRVMITSSILALVPLGHMNATDLRITEDQNSQLNAIPDGGEFPEGFAGHGLKYHASKILAHQATRALIERQKPSFSVVTLHPSFVLGTSLIQKSASDINGVNALFWNSLRQDAPQIPSIVVDVREVADAHIRAAVVPLKHDITEIIVSAPSFEWETVVSYLNREFPDVHFAWKRPFPKAFEVDVSRASEVLGMQWRPVVETVRAVIDQQTSFST